MVSQNMTQIFENQEFGNVRVVLENNDPWFIGKDVAEALGYKNSRKAMKDNVDDEDRKILRAVDFPKKSPAVTFEIPPRGLTAINESGLYSLVLCSKLPAAKQFKRWITHDVIPSIRKHGAYATDETIDKIVADPDFGIRLLTELRDERTRRVAAEQEKLRLEAVSSAQQETIKVLTPKAKYYDMVMASPNTMNITQIAADYGMSAVRMNQVLNDLKIQFKSGNQWVLYSKYKDQGYVRSESFVRDYGTHHVVVQRTKWTQKGRIFLYDLLKESGILPVCEMEG